MEVINAVGSAISCILIMGLGCLVGLVYSWRRSGDTKKGASSFDVIGDTQEKRDRVLNDLQLCSFDDICGLTKEKQYLREILTVFNKYESFVEKGIEPVRGVLLCGQPGCGKTMLAKAMAKEAGVNFICRSASDLVGGNSAHNIIDLFAKARENQPCILFIDELDIIASSRSTCGGMGMGSLEQTSCTTQFLAEMDGFGNKDKILVVATTNLLGDLDKAVLRSGRFSRKYYIGRPKRREDILSVIDMYKPDVVFEDDLTNAVLINMFSGLTPADIKVVLSEAGVQSVLNGKPVSFNLLNTMRLEVMDGACKDLAVVSDEKTRRTVAVHEAGHAVVAEALGLEVYSITTLGLGSAGGLTSIGNNANLDVLETIGDAKNKITCYYGGLEAELLKCGGIYDEVSLGASEDLAKASGGIKMICASFGVETGEGLIWDHRYDGLTEGYLESMSRSQNLSVMLRERAGKILRDNEGVLDKLTEALLEEIELSYSDVRKFFDENKVEV